MPGGPGLSPEGRGEGQEDPAQPCGPASRCCRLSPRPPRVGVLGPDAGVGGPDAVTRGTPAEEVLLATCPLQQLTLDRLLTSCPCKGQVRL